MSVLSTRFVPAPPSRSDSHVVAVLGPTNTGKTHLAIERMLGHQTGIIGLPLRLLAREIYDRIAAQKGPRTVALVTGEEKIIPREARWFVCTVEAMPLDRPFDFLAIDEIQLCADPERGHVFTDRLLRARGRLETMFLGADTVKTLIRRLVPGHELIQRERLSRLYYTGEKKLSRLPRRSAVVAFSSADVYAIAELIRSQRGGAAVVLGALSPRTRNAQVALYQSGEVDYLVATDAIGMGLNMDIDHVAFAGVHKFDGLVVRKLTPGEMGQIAGRAGPHLRNGSFGTTGDVGPLDPEMVERLENHHFDPVTQARWRSADLDFTSLPGLVRSLEQAPPNEVLLRARDAEDYLTLRALAGDQEVADMAKSRGSLRLLWQICQIPDFRKTLHDQHVRLVRSIFLHLGRPEGVLPADWVARQMTQLDRTDGDIDTLSTRLAHIRTWTYVSHRAEWLADPKQWQERARSIEDRLSDALHARLTQRFVDRRAAMLSRSLDDGPNLTAEIADDGTVAVAGEPVGRLDGLAFRPLEGAGQHRALRAAANRVLGDALRQRAARLAEAPDEAFELRDDGAIAWNGAVVAHLGPGETVLKPRFRIVGARDLDGPARAAVQGRLAAWLDRRIERRLGALRRLLAAELAGPGRGIAFQIAEGLGAVPRRTVAEQLDHLVPAERHRLKRLGVQFGEANLFLPALLKPEAARLAAILHAARRDEAVVAPPRPGLTSVKVEGPARPDDWWRAVGFQLCGPRAVRLDILERVAELARAANDAGPFEPGPEILALLGCGKAEVAPALQALGYRRRDGDRFARRMADARRQHRPPRQAPAPVDPASPFAKLRELAR